MFEQETAKVTQNLAELGAEVRQFRPTALLVTTQGFVILTNQQAALIGLDKVDVAEVRADYSWDANMFGTGNWYIKTYCQTWLDWTVAVELATRLSNNVLVDADA